MTQQLSTLCHFRLTRSPQLFTFSLLLEYFNASLTYFFILPVNTTIYIPVVRIFLYLNIAIELLGHPTKLIRLLLCHLARRLFL